jgi:putative ABC transport system permease protein
MNPNWKQIVREHLTALRLPPEREIEIVEEQALHLEAAYEDALAAGLTEAEAEARAVQGYDWRLLECELSRAEQPTAARAWRPSLELIERKGGMRMESLLQDVRFGARMLAKNPGFTLIAVITLALGIGANTAIFSVVYALLLRPLPYHEPDRLVLLTNKTSQARRAGISYPNFSDWRERAQSFEGMASWRGESFNLTGVDKPVQLRGLTVNWNFFALLGVQPQLGRMFTSEDDRYGAARTALLSHGIWQEKFGGEPSVIGKKLSLDGEPHEVIGVLPQGFEYFRPTDVYIPMGLLLKPNTGMTDRGTTLGLTAVARLKPGVTLQQANDEMVRLAAQVEREYPAANTGRSAQAEFLQDFMSESVRQSLWVLLGAVGFILLIACVNVANLLLAQAAGRQKEIAVRLALGAGRWRITRQLLSESLLIALLGGVCGVFIGRWMVDGLLALAPGNIPQLSRVSLNNTVLLFTFGVSVLTSVLCGLAPALHASRVDLHATLKEGGRSSAGGGRELTRKTLLVVEVSLALVLLVGAGLLARSMARVLNVDPGFNPDNLITLRMMPPNNAYDKARRRVFFDECLTRVSALPGVRSAAITHALPIGGGQQWGTNFYVADKPIPQRGQFPDMEFTPISANYFEAMGIQLLRGRWFNSADAATSSPVTVINEALARRIWPGEDPLGKRLKRGLPESDTPWLEVVGVVADVKVYGVEFDTPMQTYVPLAQLPPPSFWLTVRTVGDPLQSVAAVERAIHSIDKDLPVFAIQSMDQVLGRSRAQRLLTLTLMVSFAALALLLAVVGIYGVISYSVKQRTHELGIRIALGAQRGDVLKLILTQGMKLALIGMVIGLGAALALTRWMETLLFGVRPTDPVTFGVIAVVLLSVALLACWIPARRATKVDPLIALRTE